MKPVHLAILAAAGVGVYFIWKRMPQSGSTQYSPFSEPNVPYNNQLSGQPSNQYPIRPIQAPRVDNTSQPWYAGSRAFNLDSPDSLFGSDFKGIVSDFQGLADISGSLSSIYEDLGIDSWFSGEDALGGSFGVESYDTSWQTDLAYA